MTQSVAIIGDRFMLPRLFEEALRDVCGDTLAIRSLEQPWPDEPMEHGYAKAGMDGLKEYMGQPDDIVAFIGDAPILVTHLAPLSAGSTNAGALMCGRTIIPSVPMTMLP